MTDAYDRIRSLQEELTAVTDRLREAEGLLEEVEPLTHIKTESVPRDDVWLGIKIRTFLNPTPAQPPRRRVAVKPKQEDL